MADEQENTRESGPVRLMLDGDILEDARREIICPFPEDIDEVQATYIRNALEPSARRLRNVLPNPSLRGLDVYALHRRCNPGSFVGLLMRDASWSSVLAKADRHNQGKIVEWGQYIHNFVPAGMRRYERWLERE